MKKKTSKNQTAVSEFESSFASHRFLVHRKSVGFSRAKKIIKRTKDKTTLQIVKRKGHTELYDERKVYGSCFFACRNAHLSEKEAEEICRKVSASVTKWIKAKKIVSSSDIFKILIQELKKHNEDASFLYETHRDIS